ncbi:MAG: hypothetical protein K9H16_09180 [Bacteroidales bacterium]|nr:hypothetical protein [Bacteroidales bacterium]
MLRPFTFTIFLVFSISLIRGQENLPPLNRQILDYVKTTIGTKINRGECWDLAYEALERNNAAWDGKYAYGRLYKPDNEDVLPGDFIQFENVKLNYTKGRVTYTENMDHHTAVVYRVIDQKKNIFELAHQNTDFSGRKVGLSEFNLNHVTKGRVMFYRPVQAD